MRSDNNVVSHRAYHVVWCPTYRRPVITGDVAIRLTEIVREVAAERECTIIERDTMPDHGHLLVDCDPQYGIHWLVTQIKGRSSRALWQEFPSLTSRLPTLWAHSHVAAAVGGATLEVIKKYVENHRGL
ncbi:IS200/IS605 family transposase [Corynebacterium hylobatis]|uniref:IS200/IS605 family transposase n=1 Tax=Corynebacterium hylobatis TaxID=1859290 RepID=A0A430I079_9CORY|nr:IS200/IS605 family transposase [Corynebacterium hylobatis]RSZ64456.1 IS200/IS605 family transposase [Corynebacterium hylobatis]